MARYGNNHSNQFISGKRTEHDLATRIKISATKAMQRLDQLIEDDEVPPAVQLGASKVVIDKVLPGLTSVEAVVRTETETADESQLVARLQALIESNPELASKLLNSQLKLVDAA